MKSYKNLDAIRTMKRDHSSKMEQIHLKSNNLYKIDFDPKITDFQEFQGTFNKKKQKAHAFIFFIFHQIILYKSLISQSN